MTLLTAVIAVSVHSQKSNEESKKNNEYRLPKSVLPIAYDLKYTELNFTSFTFDGTVGIDARVANETREIVLHVGNLTAYVTSVTDDKNNRLAVEDAGSNKTTEKFTISLKENLKVSQEIKINLAFNGVLRNDMIGFYRSSYFVGKEEK